MNTPNTEPCRNCNPIDFPTPSEIEALIQSLQIPEGDRAGESLYQKRLTACASCQSFSRGLCRECGCFCAVRALYTSKSCPLPGDDRWKAQQ